MTLCWTKAGLRKKTSKKVQSMQKKNWRKNHKKKKSIIKFHMYNKMELNAWKIFYSSVELRFQLFMYQRNSSLFIHIWMTFIHLKWIHTKSPRTLVSWNSKWSYRTWNYLLCSRFKMAFIYKQKKDVRMAKKRIITKHCSKNTIFVLAAATVAVCDVVIWNSIYYDKKCIETRNETNFEWIAI